MNLMMETRLPDYLPGTPVKYNNKVWTLLNTRGTNENISGFTLLFYDVKNPTTQTQLHINTDKVRSVPQIMLDHASEDSARYARASFFM